MHKVNPKILRTGFLSKEGDAPRLESLVGQQVTLPLSETAHIPVLVVDKFPRDPKDSETYLVCNDKVRTDARMHSLVRFPAKLHPPFVQWAIERFSSVGDTVFDPFCGCGTVPLEATLRGRRAIGSDLDPFSSLIASSKCSPPTLAEFKRSASRLTEWTFASERRMHTYKRLAAGDICLSYYRRSKRGLNIPEIPRIEHWFKRYVIIDLARIWRRMVRQRVNAQTKQFLKMTFASILRLCSNADPDTLSGLEVTRRMRERLSKGRRLNPFELFRNRLDRNIAMLEDFWQRVDASEHRPQSASIRKASAIDLALESRDLPTLILTSPPYCSAVDYHRRHLLEHYWLRLIKSEASAKELRTGYIGRRNYVYGNSRQLLDNLPDDVSRHLGSCLNHLEGENHRARSIVQYFIEMARWLQLVSTQLAPGGRLVLVVGNSTVRGKPIPTADLLGELAPNKLSLENRFSYVLRNRSMQYSRWNHANVATENVLVFVNRH